MPWEKPVGLIDIAERLEGATHNTVKQWRQRHSAGTRTPFPEPKGEASGVPLWDWPDVERWLNETNRGHLIKG